MLKHPALSDRAVDEAHTIHNQPGMPLGQVGIPARVAALASTGTVVQMSGEATHASTPHKSNASISAMATSIRELLAVPSYAVPFGGSVLITPTHMDAGKRQFGRVPPRAELGAVIRANSDGCLELVLEACRKHLTGLAKVYGLQSQMERVEPFPVTINHRAQVDFAAETLRAAGMQVEIRERAQPWSEDFGYFLHKWPGALMLLGAGEDHPSLRSKRSPGEFVRRPPWATLRSRCVPLAAATPPRLCAGDPSTPDSASGSQGSPMARPVHSMASRRPTTMSKLLRGAVAGLAAWKLGGGVITTVLVFGIAWWLLGNCGTFQ